MSRLSDIPTTATDRQFFRFLGEGVSNRIRRRVRNKHQNANGQRFQAYSDRYEQRKTSGNAKARGASQASRSSTPDMTLTGKTLDDLQVRSVSKKHVEIGWYGIHAAIVRNLAKKKNYQIVNVDSRRPFADDEMKWIDHEINARHERELNKFAAKPVTIRIGK